jgi:hypothetical protein
MSIPGFRSGKYDRMAPISNGLRTVLTWGEGDQTAGSKLIQHQIRDDLRSCDTYYGSFSRNYKNPSTHGPMRNVFGQCTRSAVTKTFFCACCKFANPEVILDNLLVYYFMPFYNAELYQGIGVTHLVGRAALHDLSDMETMADFQSGRFEWIEFVTRHFSRLHWRAVKCEEERMLTEWASFMRQVNEVERNEGLLSISEDQRNELLSQLLPDIPGEPEDGGFLYQVQWKDRLTKSMTDQVKHYFTEIGLEEMEDDPLYPFALCDILDVCFMHGLKDPETEPELWIDSVVIKPEVIRRRVNACRNAFPEKLCLVRGPSLLDLSNFHTLLATVMPWCPESADLVRCQEVLLGCAIRTMWVKYNGDAILEGVRFLTTTRFFGQKVVSELLNIYSFEGCKIEAEWMRPSQLVQSNYNTATFAVCLKCTAAEADLINAAYKNLFEKTCVSGETEWKFAGGKMEDEFARGCLVLVARSDTDEMEW